MKHTPSSGEVLYARSQAHLRLRHLRLLVAIATKGTLGGAAAEIGISQPAATQMLRELENLLETMLVKRHARGVVFTEAGQVLAGFARQTLDAMRITSDKLADLAAGRNATLQVGAIAAAVIALVTPALDQLLVRCPEDRFNVVEIAAPEILLAGLLAGSYHVILVREPSKPDPQLVFEPLFADELVIVASPEHPAAMADKVSLSKLAECEWVLATPQVLTRTAFDEWCGRAGFTPKPSNISGNSITMLPNALAATGAIAAAPASMVHVLLKQGVLRRVRVDMRLPLPALGGLYRKEDAHPLIGRFLGALQPDRQQSVRRAKVKSAAQARAK